MKKSIAFMVGLRYTSAKKSNQFVSFIALASMIGIALGTIVLITVMSVMNGFQSELQNRILGMVPHIVVGERADGMQNWQQVEENVITNKEVVAAAPFIDSQSMFKGRGSTAFGLVQGVLPAKEKQVSIIDQHFVFGSLDNLKAKEYGIILGVNLAAKLGVSLGVRS